MPISVEITVISAFAAAHGMSVASTDTAILAASPTPPPNRTNLANEPDVLRSARTRAEQRRRGFSIDGMVEPEQRRLRPACQCRCGRHPAPLVIIRTMPAIRLLITTVLAGTTEIGAAVSNSASCSPSGGRHLVLGGSHVRRALTIATAADTALSAR
ncbi:hypothetical protein [Micromonospora chersina]|uniref:hypothetical protein n=1 Tax=Micromonospora chersina TaxID=47854 RepID=UPI0033AC4E32